jgi:hypothetical protein
MFDARGKIRIPGKDLVDNSGRIRDLQHGPKGCTILYLLCIYLVLPEQEHNQADQGRPSGRSF